MGERKPKKFTDAEWAIMKVIWARNGCAARDVCAAAQQSHGWSDSTVKTLLRRLVEKGHLKTTRVGNSFFYQPTRSALKSLYRAADALLDHAVEGTVGPLLAYMARKSDLDPEELAELRALLDELSGPQEKHP